MGTMLYAGIYINQCYDAINLSKPHLIKSIHLEYIQAAEVIETNTFGANRHKLARHGLSGKVREINLTAARIAHEASEDKVWVAGSVGPIHAHEVGAEDRIESAERQDIFREQIKALIEGEVDLLILETFPEIAQLADAVAQRGRRPRDLPIVAQVVFHDNGKTEEDLTPEDIADKLSELPVDVIGANCGAGPEALLSVIEKLVKATDKPVSVQPNAGSPKGVDDRIIYLATPEYFSTYARRMIAHGVRMIGACCGSGPEAHPALRARQK